MAQVRLQSNEVRAIVRYLPISTQKLALVCSKVRGLEVEAALVTLKFMPQKGSDLVMKAITSAQANARNNAELDGELVVSQIWACEGPSLKRFKAGARGRYKPRIKRQSHLWVILSEREDS